MKDAFGRIGLAERLYRFLLLAYPAEFRRAYGSEAAALFVQLHREARTSGRLRDLLRLWRGALVQVVAFGIYERSRPLQRAAAFLKRAGGAKRGRHNEQKNGNRWTDRMDRLLQDVRYAARSLSKRPGFALITVVIVALGVGATTTIFSVVDAVLLRPLPYPAPEQLVTFDFDGNSIPVPDYKEWRDRTASYQAWGAARHATADLTGEGEPERLEISRVTQKVFSILGGRAARGRLFTPDDYAEGDQNLAVLGHTFWMRRFGGDPAVIGGTIALNGQSVLVVGALARDFEPPEFLDLNVDIYVPLDLGAEQLQSRNLYILDVVARLKADVSLAEAQAELDVLSAALAEEYPDHYVFSDGTPVPITAVPLQVATVGNIGQTLNMFLGAVALLLLIACANLANLFLARGTDREGEMALRAALGAGRGRIVAQLLTESVLIALVGGAAGVAIAYLGVDIFRTVNPGGIPRVSEVAVDLRVLGFALAVSTLTGVIFGIVPALSSARTEAYSAIREGATQATAGRGRTRLRSALVVTEIALALMLLVGAGLLFNSFLRLRQVDPGLDPEGVVTMQLDIGGTYGADERARFLEELVPRLQALPGAQAVGVSWRLPFAGGRCCMRTDVAEPGAADTITPYFHPITTGYFAALGIPIARGRGLNESDQAVGSVEFPTPGQDAVPQSVSVLPVVVNRRMAERVWPDADPVGQTLSARFLTEIELQVVGVSESVRHWTLDAETAPDIYVPLKPFSGWLGLLGVAVRHRGPASALAGAMRQAVWDIDPNLPIGEIASMEDRISRSITGPRFFTLLLATFAGIAFLLAAGGIYGSMLYSVVRRQRELGIRLALGARAADIVKMVVNQGLVLVALGLTIGIAGSLAFSRLLESLVFGITTTDAATFGVVSVVLAMVAMAACYLPARRAGSTDPLQTIRSE